MHPTSMSREFCSTVLFHAPETFSDAKMPSQECSEILISRNSKEIENWFRNRTVRETNGGVGDSVD